MSAVVGVRLSSSGTRLLDDLGSAGKGLDGAGGILSCPVGWR